MNKTNKQNMRPFMKCEWMKSKSMQPYKQYKIQGQKSGRNQTEKNFKIF